MHCIDLEGVSNFRDIGGYPIDGGKRVRRGVLYRAGEPTALTARDRAALDALGIRTIYDLRTTTERTKRPGTLWDHAGPRRLHRDYGHSGADLPAIVHDPDLSAEKLRQRMLDAYRTLPDEQAEGFRAILLEIAAGEIPLVFHCAAGKDRTGIFAAILLDLLGVSRAAIEADYLHTNRNLARNRARFLRYVGRDDVDPAMWDPLLRVEPEYLAAMFDAIDTHHGGSANYVAALGITPGQLAALRETLLETEM